MDYSDWLFIDMADLSEAAENMTVEDWKLAFPGCQVKGSRQSYKGNWKEIRNISVAFTRVGPTILDRCPQLEWVMVRGHAINCVDVYECKRRGIGVVSAGAFTQNCADYIEGHLGLPPYVFYGYGRIAKLVASRLPDQSQIRIVNRSTPQDKAHEYLSEAVTLVASVPPPLGFAPPLFSLGLFSHCRKVKFVSICHEPLMENSSLQKAIESGYVDYAVVDSLREKGRDDLIQTHKVLWTKDTAWKTNFKQAEYQDIIRSAIDGIRGGFQLPGIVVPRR